MVTWYLGYVKNIKEAVILTNYNSVLLLSEWLASREETTVNAKKFVTFPRLTVLFSL